MRAAYFFDLIAALGLGAFFLFGLLIPLTALWGEFLPHFSTLWDPELLSAVKMTVFQASLSAILSTAIGLAVAFVLPRNSRLIRALLAIPFGVPAVAAAAAWVVCLPKALNFSLTAVVIAHVFFNAPWVALWVLRALDEIPVSQTEAARTLGASSFNVFRFVTLPSLLPSLAAGFSQVFSFCVMSFILVMVLGGGPPVETLETILFFKIRAGGLDLSGAAACAVWQLVITMIPWIVFRRTRVDLNRELRRGTLNSGSSVRSNFQMHQVPGIAVALFFLLPYFTLAFHWEISDLLKGDFTREVVPAFWISFRLAFWTSCLAVFLGLLGVWAENRNRFFAQVGSVMMVIPAGVSVMALGAGFFLAYLRFIDPFSASIWPIVFLQAIFFVPVAFRVFQPISKRLEKSAWDAALTLGASPLHAFYFVEWPRWRRPVFSVAALVAGAACGEVAAVSLFYAEGRVPAAVLISRWMSQYRFGEALTLSLLLTCVSAALVSVGFLGAFEEM